MGGGGVHEGRGVVVVVGAVGKKERKVVISLMV